MQSRIKLIVGVLIVVFLTGCSNSVSSQVEMEAGLSENELFQSSLSKTLVQSFGFPVIKYDNIVIKEYSDPNRSDIKNEVIKVVPDFCLPVASLLSDSKESGALFSLVQTMDDESLDSNLTLTVKTFLNEIAARNAFDEFLSNADRCGTWIPTYKFGDIGISMDLWEKPVFKDRNMFGWANSVYSESGVVGISGSAIYDAYVKMDGRTLESKEIVKKIAKHVQKTLISLQVPK